MQSILKQPLCFALLFFSALGCTPQKIAFDHDPSRSLDGCPKGETTITKATKFLFLVDQSGSNINGPYEHPGMATDPQKAFRYGVVNDFIQKQGSKTHLQWGLVTFNGSAAHGMINSGNDQSPLFAGIDAMNSAMQTFMATTDVGDTPYKAALLMAKNLIQADLASDGAAYQYRIAFLTDGYPTDYCPVAGQKTCPGAVLENNIDSDVQNIINLAPAAVEMSTVYYGLPDSTATGRLERMAAVGNGQFVDTNVTKVITLDDVIKIPVTCVK